MSNYVNIIVIAFFCGIIIAPVRTGQNWSQQTEERVPAARGRCPYVGHFEKKFFNSLKFFP